MRGHFNGTFQRDVPYRFKPTGGGPWDWQREGLMPLDTSTRDPPYYRQWSEKLAGKAAFRTILMQQSTSTPIAALPSHALRFSIRERNGYMCDTRITSEEIGSRPQRQIRTSSLAVQWLGVWSRTHASAGVTGYFLETIKNPGTSAGASMRGSAAGKPAG